MSSIAESSLSRDDYEKWVWDGYSNLSAAFLLSPPVAIGHRHMGSSMFQIAVTTYLYHWLADTLGGKAPKPTGTEQI